MLNDFKILMVNDGFKPHFTIFIHIQIALNFILTTLLTLPLLNVFIGALSLIDIKLLIQFTFISFFLLLPIKLTFQNHTIPIYE